MRLDASVCAECGAALPVMRRGRLPYAWIFGGEAFALIALLGTAAMMLTRYGAPAQPMPQVTAVQLTLLSTPTLTLHVWDSTWTPPPPKATSTRPTNTPFPTVTRTPRPTLPRVGWQMGDLAPDFSLADLQGNPVRLSSLCGKVVVLNFWATWCPPCRNELPDLQSFYADYNRRGVIVLGINQQEAIDLVRDFRDNHKLTFPILLDPDHQVGDRYHVNAVPWTVFIDRSGVIRSVNQGQGTRRNFVDRVAPWL